MFSIFSIYSTRSPLWSKVRSDHIKKQPYCMGCGTNTGLEVHHIEPYHLNPSRELDPTNLITLCKKHCHFAIGHLMDYKSWNKDVIEDSGVYLNKVKNRPYKTVLYAQNNPSNIIGNVYKFISNIFWNYRP